MNKEEFIKSLVAQGKDVKEVNDKWAEFETDCKEFGITEVDIEQTCKQRLRSFYSKSNRGKGVDFEGVIVGYQVTDFGKTKMFEDARIADAEDHEAAVLAGLVNEDGDPLEKKGFNKGNPIDLKKVWNKQCLGISKKVGDEKDYEYTTLGMSGDNFDKDVPMFSLVKYKGTDKRHDGLKKGWKSNAGVDFAGFEVVKELSATEVDKLLGDYFTENVMGFDKLEEYHSLNEGNYDRLSIVKGNVTQVTVTEGARSNVLAVNEIVGDDVSIDDMGVLTCWVDKKIPLVVSEAAQNVWVLGRTNINQTSGEMSLNLMGYFCPEIYRKPANIKPVEGSAVPKEGEEGWIGE